jgi:hypothetical protein
VQTGFICLFICLLVPFPSFNFKQNDLHETLHALHSTEHASYILPPITSTLAPTGYLVLSKLQASKLIFGILNPFITESCKNVHTNFSMCVCLSVCLSTFNTTSTAQHIFVNSDNGSSNKLIKICQLRLKSGKSNGHFI